LGKLIDDLQITTRTCDILILIKTSRLKFGAFRRISTQHLAEGKTMPHALQQEGDLARTLTFAKSSYRSS
jgi:hypothetical protein